MTLIVIGACVIAGAIVVRLTGLGFALVASPLLVLLLGPFQGVLLCNLLSLITALAMVATHWKRIEWRRAAELSLPALVVVPAGALLARGLPQAALSLLIGVLLLVAILLVLRTAPPRILAGRLGALPAGVLSATLNVLAGVGGPALALYGLAQRWTGPGFVATVPVCAIVMNALSLGFKGFPSLPWTDLVVAIGALLIGTVAGEFIVRRWSGANLRWMLIALTAVGAVAAIVKGLLAR
ncbi:sulfite exporter TauE/SafE family protein [Nakamurella lactea]|uniref:sulfite exporter TauE/SafE family protein n=1 Tax=Nakamurella lactea TaxID=459515 RepID=UPI00041515B7|nr:sulfite exporter TauE/SafE family protein [Nakamurella lactea]